MSLWTWQSASIQPRTNRPKWERARGGWSGRSFKKINFVFVTSSRTCFPSPLATPKIWAMRFSPRNLENPTTVKPVPIMYMIAASIPLVAATAMTVRSAHFSIAGELADAIERDKANQTSGLSAELEQGSLRVPKDHVSQGVPKKDDANASSVLELMHNIQKLSRTRRRTGVSIIQ